MNAKTKTPQVEDVWEDRTVGAEEEHVEVAPDISAELDAALDLHPISIRLQRNLVENLKALAQLHGLGYQPLIRQILTRWVDGEVKQMIAHRANERADKDPLPTAMPRANKEKLKKAA
ncbi:hypothetical protein [Rubrivivax albus]|uniref:Uncharacterized protein n=1 Tax=Rubrivivax albus TaxID=2499835 RepID=A0A437JRT6_9BURK|nr:hypothetical protein [Rubrivivax albus]RVT49660.1 hypothetical protein ENE75_18615 [Rubrivivax albus]